MKPEFAIPPGYMPRQPRLSMFTIAIRQSVTHGHGDFASEDHIVRMPNGEFPPVFFSMTEASDWLYSNQKDFTGSKPTIVTLRRP